MKKIFALLIAGAALAGCTTDQAATTMRAGWVGKRADDFFATYGAASREQRLGDGRRVYIWHTSTVIMNGTYMACSADIVASPRGIITSIRLRDDTIGGWTLSRCAEIFGS